ncbi:hypothetical protein LX36DRAFT_416895 [Colletotrichum falcatum]|nr:hypothetical protein LX36DRAFT_416895 [Colletotrichum falcatum]
MRTRTVNAARERVSGEATDRMSADSTYGFLDPRRLSMRLTTMVPNPPPPPGAKVSSHNGPGEETRYHFEPSPLKKQFQAYIWNPRKPYAISSLADLAWDSRGYWHVVIRGCICNILTLYLISRVLAVLPCTSLTPAISWFAVLLREVGSTALILSIGEVRSKGRATLDARVKQSNRRRDRVPKTQRVCLHLAPLTRFLSFGKSYSGILH